MSRRAPLDRSLRRLAAAALALIAAIGCSGRRPDPSPRLVLLYATCSLNREFLSVYDPSVPYTPGFDRQEPRLLVFRRHRTESGQSGTAFASLFSGSQADRHGVLRHPARLRDDLLLVTELFGAAGYDVHSWLEHLMASEAGNYAQGVPPKNVHEGRLEADDPAFRELLDRASSDPGYRAFLVTNFTVTHGPYQGRRLGAFCERYPDECPDLPPEVFDRYGEIYRAHDLRLSFDFDRTVRELGLTLEDVETLKAVIPAFYKADVHYLDRLFAGVVRAVDDRGLADDALIVFTADHGEIHYRENAHFRWTHGFQLAPEVLTVPLALRGPGVPPGRYEAVTRSIDVLPTLAGLSGLDLPGGFSDGRDLSAAIRGEARPPRLQAYSHTALFPGPVEEYSAVRRLFPKATRRWIWVALQDGDRVYKLRHLGDGTWEPALFDLASDPGERHNLFDRGRPRDRAALEKLVEYKTGLTAPRFRGPKLPPDRAQEMLRELGYVE